MDLADFDYALPPELIAQEPARPRESARLLRVSADGMEDRHVRDLPRMFSPGDLLIANDTKVVPTRLFGHRGDAAVEVTLIGHHGRPADPWPARWSAFAKPGRKLGPGQRIRFAGELEAEVEAKGPGGEITLLFDRDGAALAAAVETQGAAPLPPYIRRPRGGAARDRDDYQTMFASEVGAVAAPTAGLHFTPSLVSALEAVGVTFSTVTLHVGPGTFLPVKADSVDAHVMHSEMAILTAETVARIEATRAAGGRIVAIGTTVTRVLESAAQDGDLAPFAGETDLFIRPGFRYRVVDRLMTNFHLPRSTLLMLVAAFAGLPRTLEAYRHAVTRGYRFYSYGDACLFDRAETP